MLVTCKDESGYKVAGFAKALSIHGGDESRQVLYFGNPLISICDDSVDFLDVDEPVQVTNECRTE